MTTTEEVKPCYYLAHNCLIYLFIYTLYDKTTVYFYEKTNYVKMKLNFPLKLFIEILYNKPYNRILNSGYCLMF